MKTVTFRNGVEMPTIGLGTWQITDRERMKQVIHAAFETGYRLIDTAAAYSNEIAVAKAIDGLPRSELFLSDKVWNTNRGYEAVQEACRKSLRKLKIDYLDMYLIHWPASMRLYPDWAWINAETWRGMEALYKEGLVRAIGVCNFKIHHLEELEKTAEIMPFVNQIELHPGMNQTDIVAWCEKKDIFVEASSPLGNGQILHNEKLQHIADEKSKSVAQICIRWELQKNLIVIPKTEKVERLKENIDVFDFTLTESEMDLIDSIPYCGGIGIDPDEVTQFG